MVILEASVRILHGDYLLVLAYTDMIYNIREKKRHKTIKYRWHTKNEARRKRKKKKKKKKDNHNHNANRDHRDTATT